MRDPYQDKSSKEWEGWQKDFLAEIRKAAPQFKWKPFQSPHSYNYIPGAIFYYKGYEIEIYPPDKSSEKKFKTYELDIRDKRGVDVVSEESKTLSFKKFKRNSFYLLE